MAATRRDVKIKDKDKSQKFEEVQKDNSQVEEKICEIIQSENKSYLNAYFVFLPHVLLWVCASLRLLSFVLL